MFFPCLFSTFLWVFSSCLYYLSIILLLLIYHLVLHCLVFKVQLKIFLNNLFLLSSLKSPYRKFLGGDEENRTPDPLLARQVLSQLSYTPVFLLVGLSGLEPPTSRLSGVRSNRLSYRPMQGYSDSIPIPFP